MGEGGVEFRIWHGEGTLSPADGHINTDRYFSILGENMWPVVAQHFPNRPWIFQEYNAPCHVSPRAMEWKADNAINILPWPAQSPDINVWKTLQIRHISEIQNAGDLKRVVYTVRSLYDIIPQRSAIRVRGQIFQK